MRVGVQHNSFFAHNRLISTHHGWRRRFGVVYPSVVHGHRGVGVAIVRCFFVLRWFKNPLRPGEAGKLMEPETHLRGIAVRDTVGRND
eukprot:scaffold22728_cov76-Skeletonema_marinoi.AAC.1